MLERIKSLVPFIHREVGRKKENLPKAMLKKVLEAAVLGGFHTYSHNYKSEACSVCTHNQTNGERFRAWVRGEGFNDSRRSYDCSVTRLNKDGTVDVLNLGMSRASYGDSLLFTATHYDRSRRMQATLPGRERQKIVHSFLESKVDNQATSQHFAEVFRDEGRYISRGEVVLEWMAKSRQSSNLVLRLLNQ